MFVRSSMLSVQHSTKLICTPRSAAAARQPVACAAENGGSVETRPGIAESFAPALSGFTSEMHSDVQSAQKENRPPDSQGRHRIYPNLIQIIACTTVHHMMQTISDHCLGLTTTGYCLTVKKS